MWLFFYIKYNLLFEAIIAMYATAYIVVEMSLCGEQHKIAIILGVREWTWSHEIAELLWILSFDDVSSVCVYSFFMHHNYIIGPIRGEREFIKFIH